MCVRVHACARGKMLCLKIIVSRVHGVFTLNEIFSPKFRPKLLLPATKLGQGYVFTGVCDSVHGGACMVAGGHVWLLGVCGCWGGMHGCRGACMVAGGGGMPGI